MDLWRYSFLLITIILSEYSIAENELTLNGNEDDVLKYSAKEDTEKLLEELNAKRPGYGKTWLIMPDGNGTAQMVNLKKKKFRSENTKFWTSNPTPEDLIENVKLFLYTRNNPESETLHPDNLSTSSFDPNKQTKIILHGWKADSNSSVITNIRDAYLETQDVNVIGVDWSYYSDDIYYPNPAVTTLPVGNYIGDIINSLVNETGTSYDSFHIIGHSLGAHAAGFAGSNTEEKVARITGLDPALPGFQFIQIRDTLDESDAQFVDVIHTCAGILGMSRLTGHVDFFPNGGSPFQPGCEATSILSCTQCCSHGRAHEYFAESIRDPEFIATSCSSWESFKEGNCSSETEKMGEFVSESARGPYYLVTYDSPPFAKGKEGIFFNRSIV